MSRLSRRGFLKFTAGLGAAASTGKGEEAIKTCGSYLVVEYMRQGFSPKEGEIGAPSLQKDFQYALAVGGKNELIDAEHLL
jgi:N4-(beta-N-acetylglucosaminyl)-L-asparaginase